MVYIWYFVHYHTAVTAVTAACFLCLMIFQIWCYLCTRNVHLWLPIILITLSNDVHLNPRPSFQNNFLNFKAWNVNSLAKDNFQRVRLIEARNTIFNYDLTSICETSLNDSVESPETLPTTYLFLQANLITLGMVIVRNDLSFDESIVVELKFGRKKNIFYCFISKFFFSSYLPCISNLLDKF